MAWELLTGKRQFVPATDICPNTAYQIGFQNGVAVGEIRGRHQTIAELEQRLAAENRSLDDVDADDLKLAKARICH